MRTSDATMFPARAVAWSLGLFGLLRSGWVEANLVLPLTRWQQATAELYAGHPRAPINVTAECSGTDVLALCLAAVLAWPASWRARFTGALGGIAVLLALNTIRIGTLGQAAASPALFETLHLQIWPAILVVATAGYVFLWMRTTSPQAVPSSAPVRRFGVLAILFLIAFAFCGPWIARSESLYAAGIWAAGEAALLLSGLGVVANASGNILSTSRGAFMVTPECLATALIPLYLAGIVTAPLSRARRLLALFAMPPLFAGLAIVRLLLLALPQALSASPLFLVHGFHQFVLAALLVTVVAWRHTSNGGDLTRARVRSTVAALGAGLAFALIAGPWLSEAVMAVVGTLTPMGALALAQASGADDAQGALATFVSFQLSLLLALGIASALRPRRVLGAFAVLLLTQVTFLAALGVIAERSGLLPHALLLRAIAIALPVALAYAATRPARSDLGSPSLALTHDPA